VVKIRKRRPCAFTARTEPTSESALAPDREIINEIKTSKHQNCKTSKHQNIKIAKLQGT
jgi:hypothetical protein